MPPQRGPGFRRALACCGCLAKERGSNRRGRCAGCCNCLGKGLVLCRCPRWFAVLVSFLIFFGILGGIGLLIKSAIDDMMTRRDAYEVRWDELKNGTRRWLADMDVDMDTVLSSNNGAFDVNLAITVVSYIVSFLLDLFLMLLFTCYLLMEKKSFLEERDGISLQALDTLRKFDEATKVYINYKIILSAGTGLGAGGFLYACSVDLAPLLGFMAFLLNFVPIVGSVIATVLPLPIVLFQVRTPSIATPRVAAPMIEASSV